MFRAVSLSPRGAWDMHTRVDRRRWRCSCGCGRHRMEQGPPESQETASLPALEDWTGPWRTQLHCCLHHRQEARVDQWSGARGCAAVGQSWSRVLRGARFVAAAAQLATRAQRNIGTPPRRRDGLSVLCPLAWPGPCWALRLAYRVLRACAAANQPSVSTSRASSLSNRRSSASWRSVPSAGA